MRKKKTRIPSSVIALAIASFVGFGAYTMLSSDESPAVIQPQVKTVVETAPMVDVIVATQDLQVGKRIAESDLAWRPWPEELWNPNFIRRDADPVKSTEQISTLINGIARFPIASGEPITPVKLFQAGDRSAMSGLLRDGMRAVAVSISPENSAGGFIMPGDMVDVVMTTGLDLNNQETQKAGLVVGANRYLKGKTGNIEKDPVEPKVVASKDKNMPSEKFYNQLNSEDKLFIGGANQYAETLIGNVRVLGIDRNVNTAKDAQANGNNNGNNVQTTGTTATLEVTPEQAKLLAWASVAGRLTLTLRSMVENSVAKNERQMDVLPETESSYATSLKSLATKSKDVGTIQVMRQSKSIKVSAPTTEAASSAGKIMTIPESKKEEPKEDSKEEIKPQASAMPQKAPAIMATVDEHTPKNTTELAKDQPAAQKATSR